MALNITAKVQTVPQANLSRFRSQRITTVKTGISMKAKIRDDLKAGGSLPTNFVVELTAQGISVDLTA